MRRAVVFLFALLALAPASPAVAADSTSALLRQLDTCDRTGALVSGPNLGVLLALADGRSAPQVADLLAGPRPCTGHPNAVGHGAGEILLVGALTAGGPNLGAILWVDRGYWRAAHAPIGYAPSVYEVLERGTARELFVGIASGGSAGMIGATAVRLDGATARTIWQLPPALALEIQTLRLLDDDHLLIDGRDTRDRLFTWQAHAGWPAGAQRLFEREGDTFVLAASRQARDPYWVMTGFVGGAMDASAATMSRFATADAVAAGLALAWPLRGPYVGPLTLQDDRVQRELARREWASWDALPAAFRGDAPTGPVWGLFGLSTDGWRSSAPIAMRFDRDANGWTITAVWPLQPLGFDQTRLFP